MSSYEFGLACLCLCGGMVVSLIVFYAVDWAMARSREGWQ